MFERYTDAARQAVFTARSEASQFGSSSIEPAHLLLGILRADGALALRLFHSTEKIEAMRGQLDLKASSRKKSSKSVDLPLSQECQRVLAYAAQEAERYHHRDIAPEHLVVGLLRDEQSVAGRILAGHGVTADRLMQELTPISPPANPTASPPPGFRDLTAAARDATVSPLIGRESELERVIGILSRRTRNNPVLIGEPGVGKNTLVLGLAHAISECAVPDRLAERPVLAIEASSLLSGPGMLNSILARPRAILYIRGLFDLAGKAAAWGMLEALHVLEPHLAEGRLQCIATGTPFGLRLTLERAEAPANRFEVVSVLAPAEEEATRIVSGVKHAYETFHNVVITDEAIETAIAASRWFLRHRHLPDRAIDLIDDAGARVRLRGEGEPRGLVEIRKRIRLIVRRMENAIANHQFDQARLHSDEERTERQNLERVRQQTAQNPPDNTVRAEDILDAVAARARIPVASVRNVLQMQNPQHLDAAAKQLAGCVPLGREWADALAAYLAGCSAEEAERLAQAIRSAKSEIDSAGPG